MDASTERALGTTIAATRSPSPLRGLVRHVTAAGMLALIVEIILGVPAAVTALTGAAVIGMWVLEAVVLRTRARRPGPERRAQRAPVRPSLWEPDRRWAK